MTPPDLDLPNDVEMLKAMVLAMAEKAARVDALASEIDDLKARNADADARIERLTQILKAFDRARFGRRSEKLGSTNGDDEQLAFVSSRRSRPASLRSRLRSARDVRRRMASVHRAGARALRPIWNGSKRSLSRKSWACMPVSRRC